MTQFAFFGTPDFALPTLEGLHQFCLKNNHKLAMVVCQPDKPAHRGKKLGQPPIKTYAQKHNLPVFQPSTLKKGSVDGDDFFSHFQKENIEMAIVVAYGHLIPKRFLQTPKFGFINVHASLLPRWRGASPIQKAIESGDQKTGVSIMDLDLKMDEGDVYLQKDIYIELTDDTPTLSGKLKLLGKDALLEALPQILEQTLAKTPQAQDGVTYAAKLTKEAGKINWDLSAQEIINHCRAMHPWPGNYTFHNGAVLRLFQPTKTIQVANNLPGTGVVVDNKNGLTVSTASGFVNFAEGQLEGKKRLPIKDLINGYPIEKNDKLGA